MLKGSGFLVCLLTILTSCVPPVSTERSYRTQHPKLEYLRRYAESFIGTPYRYGGTDRNGMDCSGLVVRVYADVLDIQLPHSTERLYHRGRYIPPSQMHTGDLVFFGEGRYRATHVGIFVGGTSFIHASSSKGVVVSDLESNYYQKRFIAVRRVLSPGR